MTYNEKMLKIIAKHGIRHQAKHLCSEADEVLEAVVDMELCKADDFKEHLEEEVADVLNFINEIILWYDLNKKNIISWQKYKIDRQCKRDNI